MFPGVDVEKLKSEKKERQQDFVPLDPEMYIRAVSPLGKLTIDFNQEMISPETID